MIKVNAATRLKSATKGPAFESLFEKHDKEIIKALTEAAATGYKNDAATLKKFHAAIAKAGKIKPELFKVTDAEAYRIGKGQIEVTLTIQGPDYDDGDDDIFWYHVPVKG